MKLTKLTEKQYKLNFTAFVWHALFLSLMKPFLDTDTIIPAMIIKAGGNETLIGLATAILVSFGMLFQFFFGSFVSNKPMKKTHILIAINIRVLAILGLGVVLIFFNSINHSYALLYIFLLISIFAISGAYGGISYTDLVGKSIKVEKRKAFFSIKNLIGALGFFGAAFVAKRILKSYHFPKNYAYLYIIASILLAIASLAFWVLRERITIPTQKKNLREFIKLIPVELKQNKNLKYYLILINTLVLSITAFPFLVSYAKSISGISNAKIGNFLIMKVAGMVIFSLLIFIMHKKTNYKSMLIASVILGSAIPILALIFAHNALMYSFIFFIAGSLFSILKIAKEGILIEISNNKNRAEYAGIAGAGSILTSILPLFSGILIAKLGYTIVFISISVIVLSSLYFTLKLDCK
jgi:MFS family permease